MKFKNNYILLTAVFPEGMNTVYAQLENCILSIVRLRHRPSIFVVTNDKSKIFRIIKNNKINLNDFIIENISASKKNYLKGHKISDFKYTFAKIQSLRIFLEKKLEFNSIIISDIDCIFTKKIKFLVNKKKIIFTALIYYSDQENQKMHHIFSFFLRKYTSVFWINSGFMLFNRVDAKKILKKIDQYFEKFVKNGRFVKKTINHYGDEILFSIAINFIKKKRFVEQSESFYENLCNSPLIALIWTLNCGKNYLRFLNPFRINAHIHLPDLKYSMANQVFIKKILDKLEPSLADFILSIWINSKIFKNKLIIYNLSKVKRLFFKNINAK